LSADLKIYKDSKIYKDCDVFNIVINELYDEWFTIELYDDNSARYWLCDQFEGLVMLLKDLKILESY